MALSLVERLENATTAVNGEVSFLAEGNSRTTDWRGLYLDSLALAPRLRGSLPTAQHIGILADTGPETISLIQAAWLACLSVTLLPPAHRGEDLVAYQSRLEYFAEFVPLDAIFVDEKYRTVLDFPTSSTIVSIPIKNDSLLDAAPLPQASRHTSHLTIN